VNMSRVFLRHVFYLRCLRLRSVRRQLGRDVSARLVSALVLSHLDYCNAVLVGLPAATLAPLQRVLRAAARLVLDLKPRDHVSPALRGLHWLPVVQRIDYKLCLLVHKALIGQAPDYITNLLTLVTNIPSRSSLRASSNGDLFQRRTERQIGDRAFSVAAPRAWNRLTTELKLMRSSTATFRSNLKYFLFRTAY